MAGMTVYYRLSEENVQDVNFSRKLRAISEYETGPTDPIVKPIHSIFHGAPVKTGMVCPAEVFKPYSVYEHLKENGGLQDGTADDKKSFSGFADLRVHLPGNDTLWVSRAVMDPNPSASDAFFGLGVTVVPEIGKFTVVQPAPLLY